MKKSRYNFTLSDEAINRLKQDSEIEGIPMSALLDKWILEKTNQGGQIEKILRDVYDTVSKNIEALELLWDYDPVTGENAYEADPENPTSHLSPEGENLLEMLNRYFDELRDHPSFRE